jgi:hypothetical protein
MVEELRKVVNIQSLNGTSDSIRLGLGELALAAAHGAYSLRKLDHSSKQNNLIREG